MSARPVFSSMVSSLLIAVIAAGCGSGDQRAECEARIVRMEQTIAAIPREARSFGPAEVDAPTSRTGTAPTDYAPIVRIAADRSVRLDGRPVDAEQMRADLATLRRNWGLLHGRAPYTARVDVWADRDLSLADVRAALAGTEDHRAMIFAYDEAPGPAIPPCPPSLGDACARIASAGWTERGDALSGAWRVAVGTCPQLITMFGALANADLEARGELMRTGIPEGLRACGCGYHADEDAIEYLSVITIGNALDRRVLSLELPPPSDADATTTLGAWRAR